MTLLALALGCTQEIDAGKLANITITDAWIDEFGWGSFAVLGGAIFGSGTLRAHTPDGSVVRQEVGFSGAVGGLGLFMMGGSSGRVDYALPELEMPGEALFGHFDGSLEAFVVAGGYQSLHLRSEEGVELDSEGFGALMGVGVAAVGVDIRAIERPAQVPSDTGLPWDSGDSEDSSVDSAADPGGSDSAADSGDSGGSDSAADSGDSGGSDSAADSGAADSASDSGLVLDSGLDTGR